MGFTKLPPKLTIEELQKLMQIASNQASSVSADSEGTIDGNEVYLDTLVDRINQFFVDEANVSNTVEFIEIPLRVYNANLKKPQTSKTILVDGGCAYWDGENWRTLMDSSTFTKFPIICWPVTWWAYLPSGHKF